MGDSEVVRTIITKRRSVSRAGWPYTLHGLCDYGKCGKNVNYVACGSQWFLHEEEVADIGNGRHVFILASMHMQFCSAQCARDGIKRQAACYKFDVNDVIGYGDLVKFIETGIDPSEYVFASAWTDQDPPPSLDDILESNSREKA